MPELKIKENNIHTDVRLSCPSLLDTLRAVYEQVDRDGFKGPKRGVDPMIDEICLVIAEVYVLDANAAIKIQGSEISVSLVKEVYSRLTHDHIELVYDNIREQTKRIFNKKPYIRTALYNSVFEINTHYTNLVNHDRYNS